MTETPPADDPPPAAPPGGTGLPTYAVVVAVGLLVVYLALVLIQWFAVDGTDLSWARRSELLTGIEALAFAAAGAVLGTTVQRQVTARVEKEADEAKAEAEAQKERSSANEKVAEKGRALLHLIATRARQEGAGGGPAKRGPGLPGPSPAAGYQELLDFAASFDDGGFPGA